MGGFRGSAGCEATAEDAALQAPTPGPDTTMYLDTVPKAPPFVLDPVVSHELDDTVLRLSCTTSEAPQKAVFIVPWDGLYEPRCTSPVLIDGRMYVFPSGILWEDENQISTSDDDKM